MKAAIGNAEVFCLALLSGFLFFLPVFVPVGGGLLAALAPFPLIALAVKHPWRYAAGVFGLESGLLLLGGRMPSLWSLGHCGLIVLAVSWAIRRSWSISQTMVGSLVVPGSVGAVLLMVYSLFGPSPLPALTTRYFETMVQVSQEYVRAVEQFQEEDEESLKTLVEALPQLLLMMLPALLVLAHLGWNVLNYLLVRWYCRHSQPPLALDPVDLACWRASDHLVWIFLASGGALLVPIDLVATIGFNVLLVTLGIYLCQGLAIMCFWARRLPLPVGVQWLLLMTVFLLAGPACVVVCTAAGLFDLWIDFRRQRRHTLVP